MNARRAELDAQLRRLDSAIANLATAAASLAASRLRIQDADFAALTRAQILQQAGTAMIAQANLAPEGVLNVLIVSSPRPLGCRRYAPGRPAEGWEPIAGVFTVLKIRAHPQARGPRLVNCANRNGVASC